MGFKRQKRGEHHIKTHPTLMTYRTTRSAFTRELLSLKGGFLMVLENRAKRKESKKVTLSRMNVFRWPFSLYYR